jgi:ribosomal protein S18 acetylase RimI-like enzyme
VNVEASPASSAEATLLVRRARVDDAPEIANVHLNSWREAYQGLLPQDFLDSLPLTFKRRMVGWRSALEKPEPGMHVFVVEHVTNNVIVGFCSTAKARDDFFSGYSELTTIYLMNRFHGLKLGSDLLDKTWETLRAEGYKKSYCWVLKDNPTIGFYSRMGGTPTGREKTVTLGGKECVEVAYEWKL